MGHPGTHNEDGPRRVLVPHRKAPANAGQGKLGLSRGPFASVGPWSSRRSQPAIQAAGLLQVNDSLATRHIKSLGQHGSADRD